jgi:hypothetical protein
MVFFIPSLLLAAYLVVVSCFCRLGAEVSALVIDVKPRDFPDTQCVGFITAALSVAIVMVFIYVAPLMFWHMYKISWHMYKINTRKHTCSVYGQVIVYMTHKQILNRLKTGKLQILNRLKTGKLQVTVLPRGHLRKKTIVLQSYTGHRMLLLHRTNISRGYPLLLLPDCNLKSVARGTKFLTWRWRIRIFAVNCCIAYSILFAMRVRCLLALEPRYIPLIV